jgi:hypothetical protein
MLGAWLAAAFAWEANHSRMENKQAMVFMGQKGVGGAWVLSDE